MRQFIELSHSCILLYNSNPDNVKIEGMLNWDHIVFTFSHWRSLGFKFIVSGYLASAYYGLMRASPIVEIITPHMKDGICAPFVQIGSNLFEQQLKNSTRFESKGIQFYILSLSDLINNYLNSPDEIKRADAILLQKSDFGF